MRLNAPIPDELYIIYKQKVNNVSADILEYVQQRVGLSDKPSKLKNELSKLLDQQKVLNAKITITETTLLKIQHTKTKEQNKKNSFDPFAHLEGNQKQYAIAELRINLKKNKCPAWAKDKGGIKYATQILNKLLKQIKKVKK